jgi:flagellar biosynthesis/type III secretory pathway M-ring protein FliF/YscJ
MLYAVLSVLIVILILAFILWAAYRSREQRKTAAFYREYDPPTGQAAIEDRKAIAEQAKKDHPEMNRQERRAAAHKVQGVMAERAAFFKKKG